MSVSKRLACASVALMLVAPTTHAQIEEVTVTAQRREESLQEVPVAVSAFTSEKIEKLQIDVTMDLGQNTPSLQTYMITANATAMQVFMRGAGVQNPGFNSSESPVGIYEDGVFRGRLATANLDLADVERIEVLRGPQGTLYGRNTIAGAINIVTRTPGEEGWLEASVGAGDLETVKLTASGGTELVDGLAGSLAALYHDRGEGWINTPEAAGRDEVGEFENTALRGKLNWYGLEDLNVTLGLWAVDAENDGYNGVPYGPSYIPPSSPGSPLLGFYDSGVPDLTIGRGDSDQWGGSLHISWEVADLTFRSITGYSDIEDVWAFDLNGGAAQFVPGDPSTIVTGVPGLYITSDGDNTTFSQEFQLLGETDGFWFLDGAIDWILGFYYLNEDGDQIWSPLATIPGLGTVPFIADNTDTETDSYAWFGEVRWQFLPRWTATVGLRWTEDQKDWTNVCTSPVLFACGGIPNPADPSDPSLDLSAATWTLAIEEDWDEYTPKFQLDYQLGDNVLMYLSAQKGFQAGGFQGLCFGSLRCNLNVYEPQTVWSYELGSKGDYFDDTLRLNGAVYFAQYDDIQQTFIAGDPMNPSFPLGNVGEADVWGIELEGYWSPIERINTFLVFTYTHTELDNLDPAAPFPDSNDLGASPDYTVKAGFDYRLEAFSGWDLFYGADVYYSDDYYSTVNNALEIDSFTRINGFIGLQTSDGTWSVVLSGKNLTDEEDVVSGIVGNGTNIRNLQEPRTWMFTVNYRR